MRYDARMPETEILRCGNCGASMAVTYAPRPTVCTFCGAPVASMPAPGRVDAERAEGRRTALAATMVTGALVALTCAGVVAGFAFTSAKARSGGAGDDGNSATAPDVRLGYDDAPMFADVNGDHVQDAVGMVTEDASRSRIAAFDGATGKRLWQTAETHERDLESVRALVGGLVVEVDKLGKVQAFRLANGTPAWAGLVPDKPRHFCAEADAVFVEAADESFTRFELATGRKSSVPGGRFARPKCDEVWQSDGTTPSWQIISWSEFAQHGLPALHRLEGMSAHRALVPHEDGGLAFELGTRSKGTQVAMIAAIEGDKLLWKDLVPGIDPLKTDVNVTTILAAAGEGRVVVPYGMAGGEEGARMACFEARTGKRLWDVQIHRKSHVERGVAIANGRVYYATWTMLYALSLADGRESFRIGHEF